MAPGSVPAEWRQRRVAVKVRFPGPLQFVDLESAESIEVLRKKLGHRLAVLGHDDLDLSVVKGPDRQITRLISHWIYSEADEAGRPLYAGIRYLSRLDSGWECWAAFEDVEMEEVIRQPILRTEPRLQNVAKLFGLTVF